MARKIIRTPHISNDSDKKLSELRFYQEENVMIKEQLIEALYLNHECLKKIAELTNEQSQLTHAIDLLEEEIAHLKGIL